ncbi:unnamed protein product [Caenorhabditis bovis]|uniref:B3/B4 tRNA-binding domain-containing protein n=1 Tax=Caenorhabditis bovis TaxID=2654633 RepID=A0A8S1FCZ7_9PELO|nr:unnamed protein product [Caenorhabditis bovis]
MKDFRMFDELPDVVEAVKNNRFEIVLKNVHIESVSEAANAAQQRVFEKTPQLNFLSITSCSLSHLSSHIQICANLSSLVLPTNCLTSLPDIFDKLPKLKIIDVSHNEIDVLPPSLSNLDKLESLIVANNKLTETGFPDLSKLVQLHVFDASHNCLSSIPATVASEGLSTRLHTINVANNVIEQIPDEFAILKQLKDFKINHNKLKLTPGVLAQLPKLKMLDLSENQFHDTRFNRLANDKRAKVSAILAYVAKNGVKCSNSPARGGNVDEASSAHAASDDNPLLVRTGIENLTVRRHPSVAEIRPYLVCCVFNNVDLNGDAFKKFISLQTKLHASPLCENRTTCAIGTHRLDAFQLPVCYMALPKNDLYIRALNKKSSVNATELLDNLLRDAELARKRSKRSTVDPLHRYLHLVKNDPVLACLVDSQQIVISLPPITNSDSTKLTTETTSVWVEVSSKQSLETCKKVMDELVTSSRTIFPNLSIDQVRVVENENLVSIYPDKNDLPDVNVQRVPQ